MKIPNPEHIDRLADVINSSPYFKLISMKIREIGVGYSLFEIDLDKKHLQPFGLAHGGVFAALIDTAASWALFYEIRARRLLQILLFHQNLPRDSMNKSNYNNFWISSLREKAVTTMNYVESSLPP